MKTLPLPSDLSRILDIPNARAAKVRDKWNFIIENPLEYVISLSKKYEITYEDNELQETYLVVQISPKSKIHVEIGYCGYKKPNYLTNVENFSKLFNNMDPNDPESIRAMGEHLLFSVEFEILPWPEELKTILMDLYFKTQLKDGEEASYEN